MRSEDDVHRAHDMLAQLILGEIPSLSVPNDDAERIKVAIDVLCWILRHEHNTAFEDNLQRLRMTLAIAGYGMREVSQ